MLRKNFGESSGVIVDLCKHHGVWLDHRELERILAFVSAGGLLPSRERQARRLGREAGRARAASAGWTGRSGAEFDSWPGSARSEKDLLDALGWLGRSLRDLLG